MAMAVLLTFVGCFEVEFLLLMLLFGFYFLVWVQGACVENVLDSVVVALLRDPNRKFIFAEMVSLNFFVSDHDFVLFSCIVSLMVFVF